MKNILLILVGFAIVTTLGCVTQNSHEKKIAELEKKLAELTQTTKSSTKKVLDGDLYKFLEENQEDSNLNAVKVKVADVQSSLKNFAPEKDVYITIADTKIEGRTLAIIGINTAGTTAICHIEITPGGRGPRCCPPPSVGCHPATGEVNNVHFVYNEYPKSNK